MPSSAPATTTEATTCTENGAPRAAATAPASAPPANIEKTKSTLAASTAPRTRASPNHDSQLLSLNHDMPFLSHTQYVNTVVVIGTPRVEMAPSARSSLRPGRTIAHRDARAPVADRRSLTGSPRSTGSRPA